MSNGPVFRINIRMNGTREKVERAIRLAQFALDTQIIKDCNFYVPEDQGTLKNSALLSSDIGHGRVSWNTPYARRLYYNPQFDFSKDKNPQAQGLWFEAAKAAHKGEWNHIAQRTINQNL